MAFEALAALIHGKVQNGAIDLSQNAPGRHRRSLQASTDDEDLLQVRHACMHACMCVCLLTSSGPQQHVHMHDHHVPVQRVDVHHARLGTFTT